MGGARWEVLIIIITIIIISSSSVIIIRRHLAQAISGQATTVFHHERLKPCKDGRREPKTSLAIRGVAKEG